jgi:glutamate synthase (ferredoxin)
MGRNFAAGMSGGIAYVIDEAGDFAQRCNLEMVDLEPFSDEAEEMEVRTLIERHAELTGSRRALDILADWATYREKFQRVMPLEYRRVLSEQKQTDAKTRTATVAR